MSLRTCSGGRWGDLQERDSDRVLWDVVNDYVTYEYALKIYGVVIDEKTLKLDRRKKDKYKRDKRKYK